MKESYTEAFKEQALSKVYQRGNRTIAAVAKELNMNVGTLKNWMKNMSQNDRAQLGGREKRPQDWSLNERMSALLNTHALSGETLQAWCREHGVFSHQLTQWRTEFCRPATNGDSQLMRTLKDENKVSAQPTTPTATPHKFRKLSGSRFHGNKRSMSSTVLALGSSL